MKIKLDEKNECLFLRNIDIGEIFKWRGDLYLKSVCLDGPLSNAVNLRTGHIIRLVDDGVPDLEIVNCKVVSDGK